MKHAAYTPPAIERSERYDIPLKGALRPMEHRLELDEGDRQLVLMALAHLSVERPGWDDALQRIAIRIDNTNPDGRPRMYDEFRLLHQNQG
jgi:hypothetical protein